MRSLLRSWVIGVAFVCMVSVSFFCERSVAPSFSNCRAERATPSTAMKESPFLASCSGFPSPCRGVIGRQAADDRRRIDAVEEGTEVLPGAPIRILFVDDERDLVSSL